MSIDQLFKTFVHHKADISLCFPPVVFAPFVPVVFTPMRSLFWTWRVWHAARERPRARPSPKFASIKWPDRVKPPKNHNRCWTGHFIEALHPIRPEPLRTANASIKWPDRVKPPKNHNRCWSGHFIEALHPISPDPFEQQMPLYSGLTG